MIYWKAIKAVWKDNLRGVHPWSRKWYKFKAIICLLLQREDKEGDGWKWYTVANFNSHKGNDPEYGTFYSFETVRVFRDTWVVHIGYDSTI